MTASIRGLLVDTQVRDRDGTQATPPATESANALEWARSCCGSGTCLDACPEGINPRLMLALAKRALAQRQPAEVRRKQGRESFQAMSRGAQTLPRLQLTPAQLRSVSSGANSPGLGPDETPDIVFYTGCNVLKTPHIVLLCLAILQRLNITYTVRGGPANCCGILPMRPGDDQNAGRQGFRTIENFKRSGSEQVVSWCPTCQIQFSETLLPLYSAANRESTSENTATAPFSMELFPLFLAQRLDQLEPQLLQPVAKKVALFEFPGAMGVVDAVRALLGAIPALELVPLEHGDNNELLGYHMSSLATLGNHREQIVKDRLASAEAASVDTLVGIFHSDHRELCGHEPYRSFDTQNYLELVGESMGIEVTDVFKQLKQQTDVDTIMDACSDQIAAHGLDEDKARAVIARDILGDQMVSPQ